MRRIHAPYPSGSLRSCKFDPFKFVAPTGEVLFLLQPKKTNEKKPYYNLPQKSNGASLSFQLCQRVGLTRNPARRPQFSVHGKLQLPKLKSEAACTREIKSDFLFMLMHEN